MRKYPIVKDFVNIDKPGILVMKEYTNINFGKMMDIDDEIRVSSSLNSSLLALPPAELADINMFSYDKYKKDAIMIFEPSKVQSDDEKNTITKWYIKLNYKEILRKYLYNEIYTYNPHTEFKKMFGILDENLVGQYCLSYIDQNIISRYKIKEIIFWTEYHELKRNIVPGTGTILPYNPEIKLLYQTPVFSFHAIPNPISDDKKEYISMKEYTDGTVDIVYKQTKSSKYYTFLYYYDIIFERA